MPTHTMLAGRFLLLAAVVLVLTAAPGCAVRSQGGMPPGMVGVEVPEGMGGYLTRLDSDGERNWVLHLNEMAVEAMRRGEHDLARRALDEAILNINAVFGTTPEARRARSIFFSEDVKLFKGDPHERSMTFLYRGLLYMQERDWENARAMFRSGLLQDAFAEEEQHRADWAIFDYLIAVCEARMRRPFYAEQAHGRSQAILEDFPERYRELTGQLLRTGPGAFPLPEVEHNLLVVAQVGAAPKKVRGGRYGQFQVIERRSRGEPRASLRLGESETNRRIPIVDSVYYQAATRGGRPFDAIQGRKVIAKEGSEILATGSLYSGLVVLDAAGNRDTALVGAGLVGAGIALAIFAELVQPGADVRQWQSIPDAIGVYTGTVPPGAHRIEVRSGTGRAASAKLKVPEPGEDLAVVVHFPGNHPTLLLPPDLIPKGDPES